MARAAPKSKKSKPAPKSKKVEEKEPEVNSEEEKDEQAESEEDEKANNNGSADSDGEDEPPAKRGRPSKGKAGGKKTPVKKAGRPARKTPSKKKEESEDEDDTEYEVQTIIDERTKKGAKEYLVKWKGYSSKDSTWEPESNLNCDDAIAAFQEKQKKAKEIPAKSLREGPKQTERYAEIAGSGDDHRKRHSRRNAKSPRKTYREAPDSD